MSEKVLGWITLEEALKLPGVRKAIKAKRIDSYLTTPSRLRGKEFPIIPCFCTNNQEEGRMYVIGLNARSSKKEILQICTHCQSIFTFSENQQEKEEK